MAQGKPPAAKQSGRSGTSGKISDAAASKAKAGRASVAKGSATTVASKSTGSKATVGAGKRPPTKPPAKKSKSIVNQKQKPWGLIASAVAIVVFAAVVVGVVVATRPGKKNTQAGKGTVSTGGQKVDTTGKDTYRQPALAAAVAIKGVVHRVEAQHTHVSGLVTYDTSPPTGGDHAPLWAQCTGVVYTHQLANENAVHALEHGGVWVTYNPSKVSKAQIATLAKDVNGVDRVFMTPYAGLKTPVSLQAWGYQLFVNSVTDPRIQQFIRVLSTSTAAYPEQGATCSDPYWDASKSKPGSPLENP